MSRIAGLNFRNGGKIYYFDTEDLDVHMRDKVIAETSRGKEFGTVMVVLDSEQISLRRSPLKGLLRIATEEDLKREEENLEKEDKAFHVCKDKIEEHGLEMKLVDAEYTFDNSKLIFYFTADGRVDFRNLVKDLAGIFRTRIELRQIGVRDETKTLGGLGICGRELCCHSYLNEFAPVSIKMAKEQNLSLNPTKISGVCGRLMCCLKNEADTYEYLNKKMPRKGDELSTKEGRVGEVQNVDILTQKVRVMFEDNDTREVIEFNAADLVYEPGVHKKAKHAPKNQNSKEQNGNKDGDKSNSKSYRQKKDNNRDDRKNNGQDNRDRNRGESRRNDGENPRNSEQKNQNRFSQQARDDSNRNVERGPKDGNAEGKKNNNRNRNRNRRRGNGDKGGQGQKQNGGTPAGGEKSE